MTVEKQQLSEISQKDQQYVWHPYSSLTKPIPAYEVISAEGVHLRLVDGRELIMACPHGGVLSTVIITLN